MNTPAMHKTFRQLAQQMGMQNVRALLPEQIDILLNQSCTDKVNAIIRENIGVQNDRIITDNVKIGQINDLRTLYEVNEVELDFTQNSGNFIYNKAYRRQGLIKHIHQNKEERVDSDNNNAIVVVDPTDNVFGRYMFLVDININYKVKKAGDVDDSNAMITSWYPVRIIDSSFLADTLNDYLLKNRFRSPIACVYANDTLEIYIDTFDVGDNPIISKVTNSGTVQLVPYQIRIDSIQYPKIINYAEDIADDGSTGCNLPEYMHDDIVRHAVDLYRIAISGALNNQQQQEQAQQQEMARNNYRNEGNQT